MAKEKPLNIAGYECYRCGYEWIPRVGNPKKCPYCQSKEWNVKVNGGKPA